MAVTVKGTIRDGVRGAVVEFGTFTLDPAAINANAQSEHTLSFDGLTTSDLVFINPKQLTSGLRVVGARVTAADVLGVTLANETTGSVNGSSVTYDYLIVKFGGDA